MSTLSRESVDNHALQALCERWGIRRLAMFGSATRADFGPTSDVDLLVTFDAAVQRTLWDVTDLQEDLQRLFQRPVDVLTSTTIRNPYRRRAIERDLTTLYAA